MYKEKMEKLMLKARDNAEDLNLIKDCSTVFSNYLEAEVNLNAVKQTRIKNEHTDHKLISVLEDSVSLAKKASSSYILMINKLCLLYNTERVFNAEKDTKTSVSEFIKEYFESRKK